MKRLAALLGVVLLGGLLTFAFLGSCSKEPGGSTASAPSGTGTPTATPGEALKGEKTYYFGHQEKHTIITFEGVTEVMRIRGISNVIKGSASINFDAGTGTCDLTVPVFSLRTGMIARDNALMGKTWMEADSYKTIEFKGEKATFEKPSKWTIDGKMTIHGTTRPVKIAAEVRPAPAAAAAKILGPGEWIRVVAEFPVKITDYGINIGEASAAQVNETWNVSVDLWASTEKPAQEIAVRDPRKRDPKFPPRPLKDQAKVEASGKKYILGTRMQLTNIMAESQAPLERIIATTHLCYGEVVIDPSGNSGQVALTFPLKSLETGIDLRDEHLYGADWLDAAKFPHVFFRSTRATKKDTQTWTVEGALTLRGVEKPVKADIEMKELTAEQMQKSKYGETEGIRFLGGFKVKLSDFGVKIPAGATGKVNDELTVSLDLVAVVEPKE